MKYNKNVDNIEPYIVSKGAELPENEKEEWLKLDWNEATLQPNPEVIKEIQNFCEQKQRYWNASNERRKDCCTYFRLSAVGFD